MTSKDTNIIESKLTHKDTLINQTTGEIITLGERPIWIETTPYEVNALHNGKYGKGKTNKGKKLYFSNAEVYSFRRFTRDLEERIDEAGNKTITATGQRQYLAPIYILRSYNTAIAAYLPAVYDAHSKADTRPMFVTRGHFSPTSDKHLRQFINLHAPAADTCALQDANRNYLETCEYQGEDARVTKVAKNYRDTIANPGTFKAWNDAASAVTNLNLRRDIAKMQDFINAIAASNNS